jgi:anti-sigma B factor antagonist
MNPLLISIQDAATGPVLGIFGDLDYTTVGELHEQLTALTLHPGQLLVLDLAGLTFCDSSGITALLVARNHAQAFHAGIALAGVPDHILRVLRMVGLDQVFPFHPDRDAATRISGS